MFPDSRDLGSIISGCDAVGLLQLIHASLSCEGEGDFRALFPELNKLLPFDFAHAMLGFHDEKKGAVIVHAANISFPEEWISEFVARNYMRESVIVRNNFLNYRPQYWAESLIKFDEKKEVGSLREDFKMRNGYSHGSTPLLAGQHGSMFCFSGPSVGYDRRSEKILELIVPHLHLALTGIFRNKQADKRNIHLSAREIEILDWLKLGKSSWDISVILGISERTVNYHVYNIMQKLEAVNRPQAVAAAARLGLIDIE
jgi:DNA-binding CsgD family transcriptional regulator